MPFWPVHIRTLYKEVSNHYTRKWQNRWSDSAYDNFCRITKLFYPQVGEELQIQKWSTDDLQKLTQVVTGHGLFKRHLNHWNEIQDIACSLCEEEPEDSWHLWEYCPALKDLRENIQSYIKAGLSREKGLLIFLKDRRMKELLARNEAEIRPT